MSLQYLFCNCHSYIIFKIHTSCHIELFFILYTFSILLFIFHLFTEQVSNILRKAHGERTKEDVDVLTSSPELADRLKKQAIKRDAVKLRTQEVKFMLQI